MASEAILVRASHEQYLVTLHRQQKEWSYGLTLEQFLHREKTLKDSAFGQALQCWVLVPASDPATLESYCSCETFRRAVLLPQGKKAPAYSIASVFTPPENRKKGYARRMMTLLHAEIGRTKSMRLEEESSDDVKPQWQGGLDGLLSVLYSDVGAFYENIGQEGEGTLAEVKGWSTLAPITTTWLLANLPPPTPSTIESESESPLASNISPVNLDLDVFNTICSIDAKLLSQAIASTSLRPVLAVEPTGDLIQWHILRSQVYAEANGKSSPDVWGFELNFAGGKRGGPEWGFVLFTIDWPKKTVKLLRLRVPAVAPEKVDGLLREVLEFGRKHECEKVEGWNVPAVAATLFAGHTIEREGSLPGLAWYGRDGVDGKAVTWVANEGYGWC
ncbi:hypothetical protein T439DRAFT_382578 [Meredithblackwellia eburnea MCA 4105]